MSTTETTTRKTIKNLIQILHDGRDGYRQAAEQTENVQLKDLFEMLAVQRAQFAEELEPHLVRAGEDDPYEQGGTVAGAVHRGWIDLKAALTKQDEHAILAEVERGEDAAKEAYTNALQEQDLAADVRAVVVQQSGDVLQAHNKVRALRDATKKA